jgi:hypothetical protein
LEFNLQVDLGYGPGGIQCMALIQKSNIEMSRLTLAAAENEDNENEKN